MKKIIQYFKISLSSKFTWPLLFISFLIFTTLNFILSDLLYRLSVINPRYIIFWTPDYYAMDSQDIPYIGLNYLFYIVYFFTLTFVLFLTNRSKNIHLNINKKIKIFSFIYFILSLPVYLDEYNPYMYFLRTKVYKKISIRYGNKIEVDFSKNLVITPWGKYPMHHKFPFPSKNVRELAPVMAYKCQRYIAEGNEKWCHFYPFKEL